MAFVPLKNFLSKWHFKLIGLIGLRAVGERVNIPKVPLLQNVQDLIYLKANRLKSKEKGQILAF
jgi:hypothetical protein